MQTHASRWAGLGVAALALLAFTPVCETRVLTPEESSIRSTLSSPRSAAVEVSGGLSPAVGAAPAARVQAQAGPSDVQKPAATPQGKAKTKAAAPRAERRYTVLRGDSLSQIAKRFHVNLSALLKANGIQAHRAIRPGQRLRIPAAGAAGPGRGLTRQTPGGRAVASSRGDKRPEAETAGGTGDVGPLAADALKYRGVPYRYAGMSSRGMDCSGLVARVLRARGIRAPHSSRALYQLGTPASRTSLQPDDLVFFHTRGRGISHVGIYIGDGKFVHASSGGGRVRVDTLEAGYYARRYVGARRLP